MKIFFSLRNVRARRITPGVALAGLLLSPLSASAQAPAEGPDTSPIRIAVVDLERVIGMSKSGQELQAQLQAFQQQVQTEGRTMQEEANELKRRISEGMNSLTEDKLSELQKQYEDKTIAIRRFRDDKEREGQKMQTEGLRRIEQQLEPVFEQIRDEGGYDLILNYVPGVVVMANERVDITARVVEKLNSGAPTGS